MATATGGGVGDMHLARLMSLLNDLIREYGAGGAAEILEVDRRTLNASIKRDQLSRRMRTALDRMLLAGGGSEAARQRERFAAVEKGLGELETRIGHLEKDVRSGLEEIREAVGGAAASRTTGREVSELAERVGRLERDRSRSAAAGEPVPQEGIRVRSDNVHPTVVTAEPHPGGEEHYGEGAVLVAEWRDLRRSMFDGTGLDQALARERVMELEIAMLGECGLTLPPQTEPLHPSRRAVQVDWRRRELEDLRSHRVRLQALRWVRRVLTLGVWWR